MDANKPSSTRGAPAPRDGAVPPKKPIRLNDLIPKEDVKGGRCTVFGIAPGKTKKK